MNKIITKLILPVAGLGKRMHPLTLTTPKHLVELHGKPLIEYELEAGAESGITDVILIVNPQHRAAFDEYLTRVHPRFPGLTFHIREQKGAFGDGHSVLQARDIIEGEPFAVRFCDDVLINTPPALSVMKAIFEKYTKSVVLLVRVPWEDVSRWGIVDGEKLNNDGLYRIKSVVEKPKREDAPSNLSIVGGYIISPAVFARLIDLGKNMKELPDALRIADALRIEAPRGEVLGWEFSGVRLDCGTLEGFTKAETFLSSQDSKSD